jgi:glycosyltransferase involved in cell wall biosynthesis
LSTRNAERESGTVAGTARGVESVLHIGKHYPPHVGGIETHVRDLVSHQSADMRVEVVVANDAPVTVTESLDGAKVTRVASLGTLASQPICPSMPWKLMGRNEQIVHMQLPNPWAALSFLVSGHKGRLIITHQSDTLGRPILRRAVHPFVRQAMCSASAIIVTSERYLKSSTELSEFRNKCRVVPLGIDVETFGREKVREARSINEKYGERLILAVGRLVPYKGFEFLLRAMTDVKATLLLIGKGRLDRQLRELISSLGIAERVHMLEYANDLAPYYRAAKIFVLPSVTRAEAFGLVQVEAMAAGTPVVNTDLETGVPEVSVDAVTGITVPPKDPIALARSINFLLENDDVRRKYGEAASKRARGEFSATRMAERTLKVYESVL